jgi:GNAT superfamily N-acetyltransferase
VAEIRALHADHWRDIRSLRLRSLADAPGSFTSTYARESAYDEARWRSLTVTGTWFGAAEGEWVGLAVGVGGRTGHPGDRELVGMWVAPSHRRHGIATALFSQVQAWATSEGATTLRLGVREGNEEALTAYLRMGMRRSGETVPEVDPPADRIILMECDL